MLPTAALLARVRTFFWLKCLATPAFFALFFYGYFAVLKHPAYPAVIVPATWLDSVLPASQVALIPYLSLWLYVCLPSAFMTDLRELLSHAAGNAVLAVSGLLIFWRWPTSTPFRSAEHLPPLLQFLKNVDAPGNACPSLHAASAVFACLWCARLLRRHQVPSALTILNLVWCGLIVYSTLATRQHVAIDALCGAVLGLTVGGFNLRLTRAPVRL